MKFGISDGGGAAVDLANSPATPPLNDGQWHHLVGYANRATGKIGLFLDGSLVASTVQVGDHLQMVISGAVSGSDTIKVISQ